MYIVKFKTKTDAIRVLFAAANRQGLHVQLEFRENDRERSLYGLGSLSDPTLNEVNDGSGGEFELEEATFFTELK